jgi:hypothetical protein
MFSKNIPNPIIVPVILGYFKSFGQAHYPTSKNKKITTITLVLTKRFFVIF